MATQQRRFVRIQEKGQVTLPASLRRKWGLRKGDLVSVSETADGVLITPQEAVAVKALDRIGQALKERGLDLDELIESGRDIRGEITAEKYGVKPRDEAA